MYTTDTAVQLAYLLLHVKKDYVFDLMQALINTTDTDNLSSTINSFTISSVVVLFL